MILIHTHKYRMEREICWQILLAYLQDNSYLNLEINRVFKKYQLNRQEKDLITKLVYGVVQYRLNLEYQLAPYLTNKKVKLKIKVLFLMAVYQFLYLDKIPNYAIVSETVNLAKKIDSYSGKFVNAILRKAFLELPRSDDGLSAVERLSVSTSHPLWLVKMLQRQYGEEECQKILMANNQTPQLAARVNRLKTKREDLLVDPMLRAGGLGIDAVIFLRGNVAESSYYQEGLITVQDQASQLVAPLLDPQVGDYVLDMCAAPGTKTTHLAALMKNKGKIVACDLFEHKMKLIAKNCQRLGCQNVELHLGDSRYLAREYGREVFDRILLDAPCSGLGVLGRKPEIRYHDSRVMDTLIPLQAELLENAYILLKNNGRMVYSTCTINKKENEYQIAKFIQKHPDMLIIEERTILPYQYHSDGFYMCKLVKKER